MVIVGQKEFVAAWVAARIKDMPRAPERDYEAIGFTDTNGRLIGGALYTHFGFGPDGSSSICLSAAGETGWLTKAHLRGIFDYPFLQLKVRRITAFTAKANRRTRDVLERAGFRLEGCLRDGIAKGKDSLVYGMLSQDCIWIKSR